MIGTTAAILGAAVLGGGASLLASSHAANAAMDAGQLQADAANHAADLQFQQYQQTREDLAPWRAVGQQALGSLQSRFLPSMTGTASGQPASAPTGGVSMTGNPAVTGGAMGGQGVYAPTSAPATQSSGGGFDGATYLQQNPDVAAEYAKVNGPGLAQALGLSNDPHATLTPEQFAAWHYQNSGQSEGRTAPMLPSTPTNATGTDGGAPGQTMTQPTDPTVPGGSYAVGARPDVGSPPAQIARTDLTRASMTRPSMTRPTMAPLDVSLNSFQASPDYQFRLNEAIRGTNAGLGALGQRMSGARVKALEQRAGDLASGEYTQWRDYTTGQYNTNRNALDSEFNTDATRSDSNYNFDQGRSDQNFIYDQSRADQNTNTDQARADNLYTYQTNRSDNNYLNDRNYTAGRYDTSTSNLFQLAGLGQGATMTGAQAGQTYATNAGNLAMTGAQAQGNAGIQAANAYTSGLNNLMTLGTYAYGMSQRPQTSPAMAQTWST